jgi:ABC-type sugar transport system permease subunit
VLVVVRVGRPRTTDGTRNRRREPTGRTKGDATLGNLVSTVIAVVLSIGIIAGLFTGVNLLCNRLSGKWDARVRPWVFVGPALIFLFIGLLVPAIRTIYLSFHGGDSGEKGFTLQNYKDVLTDKGVISFDKVGHIFTSKLFLAGLVLAAVGIFLAARSARRSTGSGRGLDLTSPGSSIAIVVAVVAILFGIFSTLRGVLWNNLWWVVAVTGLATVFGLGLAVLADRSRSETAAKTLIFMPMAISLVGASVIWSYMYNIPAAGQSPGLLNAVLDLFGRNPIDFVRGANIIPWNNFFIMIIMIWIQTGFAMVVLSAGIKSVPSELTEAAKVDGASDTQVFWKITLPQIIPTVLVVVTTLIVTVMKVFDLVKASTNGNFDTDVLANRMYENLRNGSFALSSTFAVIILVLVLPVLVYNARRGQREAVR